MTSLEEREADDVFSSDPELQVEPVQQKRRSGLRTRNQIRSYSSMSVQSRPERVAKSESVEDTDFEDVFNNRAKSVALGSVAESEDDGKISRKRLASAVRRIDSDDDEDEENRRPATAGPRSVAESDDDGRISRKRLASAMSRIDSDDEKDEEYKIPEPEAPPKRGRGRPRKATTADDGSPKKKRGPRRKTTKPKEPKEPKPKARRIKQLSELEADTRAAMQAEEARLARLKTTKTTPEEIVPETVSDASNVVILDKSNEHAVLQVHPKIAQCLKKHQVEAVDFMWTACCESLERLSDPDCPGSGCIVAHCMGLGKTLSVISFVHTLLSNQDRTNVKRCLVLTPLNTVLNWLSEFDRWVPKDCQIDVYDISSSKDNKSRAKVVHSWYDNGGVLVMGYDIYRILASTKPRGWMALSKIFPLALTNPGADLVVCDEGHILKSEKSAISKILNLVRTRRRIILTGTPLQNNLNEYHCMVSFVKPNFLGTKNEFSNLFANPIKNGETLDASDYDVLLMKKRTSVLFRLLGPCVHRRGYEHLANVLPVKMEYVLKLRLTSAQCELYIRYLREIVGLEIDIDDISETDAHYIRKRLFTDFHNLQYISSHPGLLFDAFEREKKREIKRQLNAVEDVEDDLMEMTLHDEEEEDIASDSDSEEFSMFEGDVFVESQPESRPSSSRIRPSTRGSSRMIDSAMDDDFQEAEEEEKAWFESTIGRDLITSLEISSKFSVMLELLRSFEAIGDKTLIFSQSVIFLDLFEKHLVEEEKRRFSDESGALIPTFKKGEDFFRIDGKVNAAARRAAVLRFNNPDNTRARLFLISTKAGGIGINLIGANRVVLTDASWNPSNDVQAIFRAYRFGQHKPVGVYRLIAAGTMEERIYDRQVNKQSLAHRVVDEQQIARHFTTRDLLAIYRFNANESRIPDVDSGDVNLESLACRFNVPKDGVLASLLHKLPHVIADYHDHDSLLVHQVNEQLNEEERLVAWREYELAQKGVKVDSSNPYSTLLNMSMHIRRESLVDTADADLQALRQLNDLFGTMRDNVREFYENNLPIYEKRVEEAKLMRQLDQPSASGGDNTSVNTFAQNKFNSNNSGFNKSATTKTGGLASSSMRNWLRPYSPDSYYHDENDIPIDLSYSDKYSGAQRVDYDKLLDTDRIMKRADAMLKKTEAYARPNSKSVNAKKNKEDIEFGREIGKHHPVFADGEMDSANSTFTDTTDTEIIGDY